MKEFTNWQKFLFLYIISKLDWHAAYISVELLNWRELPDSVKDYFDIDFSTGEALKLAKVLVIFVAYH